MHISCLTLSLEHRGTRRFARLSYRTRPAYPYILSTAIPVVSADRQRPVLNSVVSRGCILDDRKVQTSDLSCVGLRHVECCEYLNSHYFA